MVALSDSSTTNVSPSATSSPTAIEISISSTLSSLPISGTRIVCSAELLAAASTGLVSGATSEPVSEPVSETTSAADSWATCSTSSTSGVSAAASPATSISAMGSPTLTVAPSATRYLTSAPAAGLGISIVALSDSKTSSASSTSMLSPGLKPSSITSTVSAPPRSGTTIVCIVTLIPLFVFSAIAWYLYPQLSRHLYKQFKQSN